MNGEKIDMSESMRKGIYILPNLFTTGSLFAGFYGMVATMNGDFKTAALWILISSIFDGLDGKVARLTGTSSKFGVEYDSLADVVAFGVAPGLLMYKWALQPFGRLGWLAAFLFVVCGALRLARFNVQVNTVENKRFVGLPIPAAASMVSATVLLFYHFGWPSSYKKVAILALIYLLAFLMVSNFRYYSFKDPELIKRQPFAMLVLAVLLLIVIAAEPVVMLFVIFFCYTFSGIIGFLMSLPRRRRLEKALHHRHAKDDH
ncbi:MULTISPECIES: CDP-diacylglycerol--serine O-phosphatidyltransferase [Geobacter]|uniref:CDP-diacylglycerol--serine O-phosphatidyltransferase n=2 Tax=Geobacter TaxID=28231 RepID=A0A0C1U2N0_9BACT|nr:MULTISPECIES: CDP-diacylglycerol--serine O-phosphatidyltransferase [Geobacter]ANA40151.1 CDP-diacylglycerol--serine O-phosphatidyltransferase [Geobacter anodireducens]KIE42050.1 CDP-diacylglycerol--serine O-phosphatidyltransferase [Geobacter soli]MBE2886696.1 CDP-diacylglycerol--serine O-phosphatidyltransferase [Geobacter anodireducens]HMN02162.1 CDP-diacylglycerol--serine O-phosphatidyltransferase [Geobacter anodireducens]